MHRGNAHRTNQPTSGGRYAEGAGRRSRLRKFPPLFRHRRLLAATLHLSRTSSAFASLPHLLSRAVPGLSFTFHRRRRRLRVSVPISLDRGFFAILFAPSLSHPETSRDSGGGDDGRPEGATVGIGTQPRQFSYRTT